jgi:hypothetical protein
MGPYHASMKRSAFRSSNPPRLSGQGPILLLVGGVVFVVLGVVAFSYGLLLAFSQMDTADGPPTVFLVIQWAGLLSIAGGAAMAISSLALWIWRIARRNRTG